jgi:isoamylase
LQAETHYNVEAAEMQDPVHKKKVPSPKTEKKLLDIVSVDFAVSRGHPLPLGATLKRGGINFAVFSKHATLVTLVLFIPGKEDPVAEFPLDPRFNRTGYTWHVFVGGLDPGIEYGYRAERQPNDHQHIHRFDVSKILIDPYAKALSGGETWGRPVDAPYEHGSRSWVRQRHCLVVDNGFDWGFDQPLNIPLADTIIYELHVRGFTQHKSSGVQHRGTYAGLIEKIPYLNALGVTAVELLPVNEFDETENDRMNALTGEPLLNFWGYHSISFFSPKASYAAKNRNGAQVAEFKSMVKAMHSAGIEVILDVVFNHTGEGDERGPTLSFRGLDNAVYYLLDPATGAYHNYSGCGNTLNCNHPVVRDMILDALRYWVTEMHVDGFRFDLASILGRGQDGSVLANPPLLERIAADPVLGNTKLIAEAWDAAGVYQVGAFPAWGRWAEWNGKFRDHVRRFVKSDPGMVSELASRMMGSPDIYQGNGMGAHHSINFVTCHDGFTLADLVSYNEKHNEANGEEGKDGANDNESWNCGWEGPTPTDNRNNNFGISFEQIEGLRRRQVRNLATILLLSRGVPMILAGDEMGRTQLGNNNSYCQDNEISWIDWDLAEKNADLLRFFRLLIAFRKSHLSLRHKSFTDRPGEPGFTVTWHGITPYKPDWSSESRNIAVQISEKAPEDPSKITDIYISANAYWDRLVLTLPPLTGKRRWFRALDTGLESPDDISEQGDEPCLQDQYMYKIRSRSVVVLVGK